MADLAEHAYKRLEKISQTGRKRGQQAPTSEEIAHAIDKITNPSVYGSTLAEVMELQADQHPGAFWGGWLGVLLCQMVFLFFNGEDDNEISNRGIHSYLRHTLTHNSPPLQTSLSLWSLRCSRTQF